MHATTMKRALGYLMGAVALIALAGSPVAFAAGETIQTSKKEGVGSYLADSKGMPLYYFKNDMPGKSACAGPCAEKWPPFSVDKVTVDPGLNAGDFGTITREDGKKQTTYKGMPLYYFSGDAKAGDMNGQGVKGVWYVVNP